MRLSSRAINRPHAVRRAPIARVPTREDNSLANLRGVIDARVHAYFEDYLAETARLLADNDQRGFYKHLKGTVRLDGQKARSEKSVHHGRGWYAAKRQGAHS